MKVQAVKRLIRICKLYKVEAMKLRNVYRWLKHFKSGETSDCDKPWSGRPVSAATHVNAEKAEQLIRED